MLASGNVERLQGVIYRRKNARRLGIRNLHVEDRLFVVDFLHCLLDEGRLTDSTAPRYFGKEPALAVEHPLQIRKLFHSTVELPVSHATPLDKATLSKRDKENLP